MKTIKELKNRLQIGVSVILIDTDLPQRINTIGKKRKIIKIINKNSTSIQFDDNCWLKIPKKSEIEFIDNNTFRIILLEPTYLKEDIRFLEYKIE